jgi:phosphopantothenoylcysteine decarboxylase/phosphopantothenate--cysteine ligase
MKKLQNKNLDLVVANDVSRSDIGMESANNEVTIFFRNGETKRIERTSKKNIAHELVKIISNMKKSV